MIDTYIDKTYYDLYCTKCSKDKNKEYKIILKCCKHEDYNWYYPIIENVPMSNPLHCYGDNIYVARWKKIIFSMYGLYVDKIIKSSEEDKRFYGL